MKTAVVGLGAMGGYMAARMLAAGIETAALVTPRHLAPLREHGLRLVADGRETSHRIVASTDPAELGRQDLVILAVKATSLPGLAPTLAPMIGPESMPLRVVAPIRVNRLRFIEIVRALIPSPRTMSMRKSSIAG